MRSIPEAPQELTRRGLRSTRKGALALAVAIPVLALLLAAVYPIAAVIANAMIPDCLLARLGIRCALCGGTRGVGALARLDIATAFYYNPLVIALAVWAIYLYARLVISCFRREYKPYRPRFTERTLWLIIGVMLIFMIIRNLPFYRAVLY